MKQNYAGHAGHAEQTLELTGIYRQPIYSPKGELEGLLLNIDGAIAQVVLDPKQQAVRFDAIDPGQTLRLQLAAAAPSPKGKSEHAIYDFESLSSVDGAAIQPPRPRIFKGHVARFNYAKHGEPNGVVLDSGDFIHLRPGGFRAAGLALGDAVQAEGDSKPMAGGCVVDASVVNGIIIEPKKPKPPHAPRHAQKHRRAAGPAAHRH